MPLSNKSTPCDSSNDFSDDSSDDEEDEMDINDLSSTVNLASTAIDQTTPDFITGEDNKTINESPQENAHNAGNQFTQYKLVFDNINKNVTPRFQTIESPTVLLNYVNMFAIRDRVKSCELSRVSRRPPSDISKENVSKAILPSVEDDCHLKENFSVLVSRILVQYLPFFNLAFNDIVDWHLKHQYYNEMSQKSEVVSMHLSINIHAAKSHMLYMSYSAL